MDDSITSIITDPLQTKKNKKKSKRGFAAMSASQVSAIASKGGKAAHAKGTAHEWSSDEARAAGRKGGQRKAM